MSSEIRILLLADSHLGFDFPLRPRVRRRRRGDDFFANYAAALAPALAGEVDLVVHAGDVFNRSMVDPSIAFQALDPLCRVADLGVPVFIVPGNHERSRLPHVRFATHRLVHVFQQPATFVADVRGTKIALSGFPYVRENVRVNFADVLERTGWKSTGADVRVLCFHHCVEGATVGPADFTFTSAADVIRARDLPAQFAAVLSGHIHRHQILTRDLSRRPLATPVLYPGSIERTSLAEIDEPKGFMVVHVDVGTAAMRWEFRRLPARPMIHRELTVDRMTGTDLESSIEAIVSSAPRDAVVSIRVAGALTDAHCRAMSASRVRRAAPDTMNVEIKPAARFQSRVSLQRTTSEPSQLSLYDYLSQST